jgi:hypothetical protein
LLRRDTKFTISVILGCPSSRRNTTFNISCSRVLAEMRATMAEPGEEEEEEEEVDQEEVMPSPTRDKFARLPRYTRAEAMEVYGQSLDGPLQPDPSVLRGTLPNGASFLVRTNREPQARAELRVVIKIGSVVEEEGERGLAHLIEHLAFRGSQGDDQSFLLIKEVR